MTEGVEANMRKAAWCGAEGEDTDSRGRLSLRGSQKNSEGALFHCRGDSRIARASAPSHRTTRLCACLLQLPPSFPCGNATSLNIALCARGRLNVSYFAHFIWHQAIQKPPSRFAETVIEGGGAEGDGRSSMFSNIAPHDAATPKPPSSVPIK